MEKKGGERDTEVGEGGKLYTYHYTVTTRMTPALRWATVRAVLMFHCQGQSHRTVSTDYNFWTYPGRVDVIVSLQESDAFVNCQHVDVMLPNGLLLAGIGPGHVHVDQGTGACFLSVGSHAGCHLNAHHKVSRLHKKNTFTPRLT